MEDEDDKAVALTVLSVCPTRLVSQCFVHNDADFVQVLKTLNQAYSSEMAEQIKEVLKFDAHYIIRLHVRDWKVWVSSTVLALEVLYNYCNTQW